MKVAVIGAGNVGATCAQGVVQANLADIVLVDIVPGKAQALALDLSSARAIVGYSKTITGSTDYRTIRAADIVVITAGKPRKPGQPRADLLFSNARIVEQASRKITQFCPGAIVIVVTNPVDVMTYLAYKVTGFSAQRVMGMSGVSDCARFNMLAAKALKVSSRNIQSVIIGPHSDKMIIIPRLSTVSGIPITQLLSAEKINRIIRETRSFGAKIVQLLKKGSAYYGPAAGVCLLVDSVINDRKTVACVASIVCGEYNLRGLAIGIPVKLGKRGIEKTLTPKLKKAEKAQFLSAARTIKQFIKQLGV